MIGEDENEGCCEGIEIGRLLGKSVYGRFARGFSHGDKQKLPVNRTIRYPIVHPRAPLFQHVPSYRSLGCSASRPELALSIVSAPAAEVT